MRAPLPIAAAALAAALTWPSAAGAAGKPAYTCGAGFDLGALAIDEIVALPRSQAAIADGLISAEDLAASYTAADRNGDGRLCVQNVHGFEVGSRPLGQYYYNLADDNASVPGS
jgi:hypothetical protein